MQLSCHVLPHHKKSTWALKARRGVFHRGSCHCDRNRSGPRAALDKWRTQSTQGASMGSTLLWRRKPPFPLRWCLLHTEGQTETTNCEIYLEDLRCKNPIVCRNGWKFERNGCFTRKTSHDLNWFGQNAIFLLENNNIHADLTKTICLNCCCQSGGFFFIPEK